MQRVLALKKSLGVAALMQRIIIISSTRLVFAWQILTGASLAFLLPMIVKIVHFQNFEFTKRNISFKHNLTMTCNCQFHQQGNYIHVLIQGKGITADNLDVQIQRRRLTVTLNKRTVVEGLLQGQVDVGNCKVKIHVDYAEIKLRHDDFTAESSTTVSYGIQSRKAHDGVSRLITCAKQASGFPQNRFRNVAFKSGPQGGRGLCSRGRHERRHSRCLSRQWRRWKLFVNVKAWYWFNSECCECMLKVREAPTKQTEYLKLRTPTVRTQRNKWESP